MLTQCPHCTASFRVSDAQLQAAHGKVRCGACMEVFNASEHLKIDNEPKATQQDSEEMFAGLDHDDSFNALANEDPPADSKAPEVNDDAQNIATSSEALSSKDADDSYLDFSDTFKDLTANSGSKQSYQSEIDAERVQHRNQTGSFADLSIQTSNDSGSTPQPENSAIELTTADSPLVSKTNNQITTLRAEPVGIKPTLRVNRSAEWLRRIAWIGGTLAIVAFIVLQLAWFQFDSLARQNYLRPVYHQACQLFGCKLPSPYDIEQIRSQNLVVRNHPLENKALIIDAIVINQAGFEQPFPDIAFTFSDLNNKVIAKSVFAPDEYLSGEAEHMEGMPANTPIHIALKILDPGKEAVNYTMEFVQNQGYLEAD